MSDKNESFSLPTSDADKKKLKDMLYEITAQMQMVADRKEAIKDIVDAIHSDFKLPKKIVNQLAKTLYKHDYDDVTHEASIFETVYEGIFN